MVNIFITSIIKGKNMLKVSLSILSFLTYLLTTGSVEAHVQLDYPVGGETFVAGEEVNIQWSILIEHDQENWDLYFSPDGGINWEEIQMDMDISQLNYRWTVPQIATENARIRIIQDNTGNDYSDNSSEFIVTDTPSSLELSGQNPKSFTLHTNYPNPFNPVTMINYELPITNYVNLSIYNLLGQKVETLVSERREAGFHQVEWDASGFPSGVYYYKIQTGKIQDVKKMVLVR
jgi:hypothetical protein